MAQVVRSGGGGGADSGVALRKEVKHPVDIGCITDMTELEFEIKVFFNPLDLHGEGGTIRQMVNDGIDPG